MSKKSAVPSTMRRWKDGWVELDPSSGLWRRNAWIDMVCFDDGIFRLFWRNLHEVHPGVFRSNQPTPGQIREIVEKEGIRAILNLRGQTLFGSYLLERETCDALGVELINVKTHSRQLPSVAKLRQIDEIFATIPQPFLMHCKSGADRAGLSSALYLLLHTDMPVEAAQAQLSAKYLHFRRSKTGVLDFMIDSYAARAHRAPISFRDWLFSEYDPDALMAHFQSGRAADFLVDRVLHRE
ncbi:tyrosine-protein phosphatase [Amaricoccus macauensis]|uniref:tyrosine-protein phosphatase n=1 Tax=Amaricoccus macauensis TaxID=57001 RepID=UPI003C7B819E